MAELIDQAAIEAGLGGTDWVLDGSAIVLDAQFADFAAAWEFAGGVAAAAEAANHHPDILVHGWNRVRITLSTHSAGGVTELDLELADGISAIRG